MALPSKMWPSPARRERKRAWELDGSVTPFAPWWPGGLEAFATDTGARPRKVQVVEVGVGDCNDAKSLGSWTSYTIPRSCQKRFSSS